MKVFQWIYIVYVVLMFIVITLFFVPVITVPYFLYRNKSRWISWAGFWMRYYSLFLFVCGWIIRVKGRGNLVKEQHYFYTPNHSSFLDPPAAIFAAWPRTRPLGKDSIAKVPFFGWMYKHYSILINRSDARSRLMSYKSLLHNASEGIGLIMFPEGTQNPNPPHMLPFQPGAFKAAIATKTPIVPMAILNTWNCLPRDSFLKIKPGIITVIVGKPIETLGYTDAQSEELSNLVRAEMQKLIDLNYKA